MSERREIVPRDRYRSMRIDIQLARAPNDRREVFTDQFCFWRCYHDQWSISRDRARRPLPPLAFDVATDD